MRMNACRITGATHGLVAREVCSTEGVVIPLRPPRYECEDERGSMASLKPLFTWRSAIMDSNLSSTARHVALTLSTYMNERGGSAFPGASRLAHDTALHLDTVKEKLRELERLGWLTCVERGGAPKGGERKANKYAATVPTGGVEHPVPETTGGSEWDDRGSSPARPGVLDPPQLSSEHTTNTQPEAVEEWEPSERDLEAAERTLKAVRARHNLTKRNEPAA